VARVFLLRVTDLKGSQVSTPWLAMRRNETPDERAERLKEYCDFATWAAVKEGDYA